MSALPIHALAVVVDGCVVLRIYRGPQLIVEQQLRRRQALVLAAELLSQSLAAERDAFQLKPPV
jgi:hypothetical protein